MVTRRKAVVVEPVKEVEEVVEPLEVETSEPEVIPEPLKVSKTLEEVIEDKAASLGVTTPCVMAILYVEFGKGSPSHYDMSHFEKELIYSIFANVVELHTWFEVRLPDSYGSVLQSQNWFNFAESFWKHEQFMARQHERLLVNAFGYYTGYNP